MIEMQQGVLGIHTYTNDIKDHHTHNFEDNYRAFQREYDIN